MKTHTSKLIKEFVSRLLFNERILLNKDVSFSRISIVTPSYNQGQFLEKTILSVLNQNYPNLEYIVIDGGSTDGSADIIKKYEKYLAYWHTKKDGGQSDAINIGLRKATGEIFAYLNADDLYLPATFFCINKIYNQDNKKHNIFYGDMYGIDEDDNVTDFYPALNYKLIEYLFGVYPIPQASSFWTKNLFNEIGGFNIHYKSCMDGEFFAKAAYRGAKFKKISQVLSCFRLHKGSITYRTKHHQAKYYNLYLRERHRIQQDLLRRSPSVLEKFIRHNFYKFKYLPLVIYKKLKYLIADFKNVCEQYFMKRKNKLWII